MELAQHLSDLALEPCGYVTESITATRAKTDTNMHHILDTAEVGPGTPAFRSTSLHVPPNTLKAFVGETEQTTLLLDKGDHAAPSPTEETTFQDRRYDHYPDALESSLEVPEQDYISVRSSSYFTNDLCSLSFGPSTTRTGSMSPKRFSQPDSPILGNFGKETTWLNEEPSGHRSPRMDRIPEDRDIFDDTLQRPCPTVTASITQNQPNVDINRNQSVPGLQGYNLSEAEHGSTLTLKEPPSATFQPPDIGSRFHQKDSRTRVQTWNDGSEHCMTALGELVDDLGYLGQIIK